METASLSGGNSSTVPYAALHEHGCDCCFQGLYIGFGVSVPVAPVLCVCAKLACHGFTRVRRCHRKQPSMCQCLASQPASRFIDPKRPAIDCHEATFIGSGLWLWPTFLWIAIGLAFHELSFCQAEAEHDTCFTVSVANIRPDRWFKRYDANVGHPAVDSSNRWASNFLTKIIPIVYPVAPSREWRQQQAQVR